VRDQILKKFFQTREKIQMIEKSEPEFVAGKKRCDKPLLALQTGKIS
jgi:hypothetical protein